MDTDEVETRRAYWFCEECGHKDMQKPLPPDRELFYKNLDVRRERTGDGGYKCRACRSMTLLPKGF